MCRRRCGASACRRGAAAVLRAGERFGTIPELLVACRLSDTALLGASEGPPAWCNMALPGTAHASGNTAGRVARR